MKLSALFFFCANFAVLGEKPEKFKSCQSKVVHTSPSESDFLNAQNQCYSETTAGAGSENGTESKKEKVLTVYFIRHAQSKWNKAKERGHFYKLYSLSKDKDAALTTEGVKSAIELKDFIFSKSDGAHSGDGDRTILKGGKAIFATSNLRRAALTLLIAFADRFQPEQKNGEAEATGTGIDKIHILSALQEISAGRDAQTHSKPGEPPVLNLKAEKCYFKGKTVNFNSVCNLGEQNSDKEKAKDSARLDDFCRWVQNNVNDQPLVVSGHSTWLQKFFQKKLENSGKTAQSKTDCNTTNTIRKGNLLEECLLTKDVKLGNGALMKFQLRLDTNVDCQIVGGSSEILHGGLEIK